MSIANILELLVRFIWKIHLYFKYFIVEGKIVTVIMSLVTLYALIGDDIRLWATTNKADPYFYAFFIVSLFLFALELLVNSLVVEGFKYSFFFWLDIIATLSLIPDIPWITDPISILLTMTPNSQSADVRYF